ncbi:hypothetical protein ACFX14_004279 [Malus domestica]
MATSATATISLCSSFATHCKISQNLQTLATHFNYLSLSSVTSLPKKKNTQQSCQKNGGEDGEAEHEEEKAKVRKLLNMAGGVSFIQARPHLLPQESQPLLPPRSLQSSHQPPLPG